MEDDKVIAAALSEVSVLLHMQSHELEELISTSSFDDEFKKRCLKSGQSLLALSESFDALVEQHGGSWPSLSDDQRDFMADRIRHYSQEDVSDQERLEFFLKDRRRIAPLIEQINCGDNAYAPGVFYATKLHDVGLFVDLHRALLRITGAESSASPVVVRRIHKIRK